MAADAIEGHVAGLTHNIPIAKNYDSLIASFMRRGGKLVASMNPDPSLSLERLREASQNLNEFLEQIGFSLAHDAP